MEIETVCAKDCFDSCFLIARVEDGRLVSIRGDPRAPITRGFVCPKTARESERIYRNRILKPHVRDGRSFSEISWSEALEILCERLDEVLRDRGKNGILLLNYYGNQGLLTSMFPLRLWNKLGAARTDYSICSKSGHVALELHYGSSYGLSAEDILDSRLVVFWGFDPAVTAPHIWSLALKARREKGVKIAVVDPRRSLSARSADIHLNPFPGSDVALAYGIMRALVDGGYLDEAFVRRYCYGFDRLLEELERWRRKDVERITGLKWSRILELAESYGELKPSATFMGKGFQKALGGAEAVRAVSLIPALLGIHRGFFYSCDQLFYIDKAYLKGESIYGRNHRIVSQVALGKHLERGEFGFVFIFNTNPAITLPCQESLRRGLERNDVFVVVHDTHWNETAELADLVLPAPTYLEKKDLVIPYGHMYVRISKRVIEPLGESRDEIWLMKEIARRLGLEDRYILEDPWIALRKSLDGALEGSFDDLLSGKILKLRARPRDVYQTPSRKIELYSSLALKRGYDPLPRQIEIDLEENEFIMLNSATPRYMHSQFREVFGEIPPIAKINPRDAERIGVKTGDIAILENDLGSLRVRIQVSEDVPERVLWVPRQFVDLDGKPMNAIVPCETQKIGGGPIFNSVRIRVRREG